MMKNSILDLVISSNSKKTRFYKCSVCGDQFSYKRLLEVHKKYCLGVSSK